MDAPWKMIALHVAGSGDPQRKYNYAVAVTHPFFISVYITHILPTLTLLDSEAFHKCAPDALQTLREYLSSVLPSLSTELSQLVNDFLTKHLL